MDDKKNKEELVDARERHDIENEFGTSFFVEAGAGSGKTRSLVQRIAGIIELGHAKIENIAAVTFTRKAAAEMRERVQNKLESDLQKNIDPIVRENIASALNRIEQSFIGTIHSFCAKLLRERPVEAGIDPGFEDVEPEEDKKYAEKVWDEYVEMERYKDSSMVPWMQSVGVVPGDLKGAYLSIIEYSDVHIVKEKCPRPDLSEHKNRISEFLDRNIGAVPRKEPDKGWDKLQSMLRQASNLKYAGYLKEDRKFVEILSILDKKPKVVQKRWPDASGPDCLVTMEEMQVAVIKPALKKWREYLHKPLMDFVEGGAKMYEKWRQDKGILNFQDLLMNTAALLRKSEEVRKYFKSRFTCLLVDEFQDTDPVQAEIMLLLTGSDDHQNVWEKITPAPGRLFVVGDPKQSIYRFRRADIVVYNGVKKIFKNGPGKVLELTSNFRSLPEIGTMTNKIFKDIFPEEGSAYQAEFSPMNTIRQNEKGFKCGVLEAPAPTVNRSSPSSAASADAANVALWIKESVKGKMRIQRTDDEKGEKISEYAGWGDFMIITKGKRRLSTYAHALEMNGVPYEITGGESFKESDELKEILKVFRAVEDTKDPVSLIAALRGLFFGISDTELYRFKKAGGRFYYPSDVPDGFTSIKDAFLKLKEYRQIVGNSSFSAAAEKIIERLGIIPLAASEEVGSTRAGNIFKALELLKHPRAGQVGTFAELVDNMICLMDEDIESMNLVPGATDVVRLMNLHKAKGLEAPVVILADPLGDKGINTPQTHISRKAGKAEGYFAIIKRKGDFQSVILAHPEGWEEKSKLEEFYLAAEKKRLEYVALTRAKNTLVVSTYRETKSTAKQAWNLLYEHLGGMPKMKLKGTERPVKREVLSIGTNEWGKGKDEIASTLSGICKESYSLVRVTEEAKQDDDFEPSRGEGARWGLLVHKALEVCGKGNRDLLDILARSWVRQDDKNDIKVEDLIATADEFMKSDMWERIKKAGEKYFEMPFAINEDNTVLYGVIDAVFKEKEGWVILDYKTDDFEADAKRKEGYKKQIDKYAECWEKLTKEKVKETVLYRVK